VIFLLRKAYMAETPKDYIESEPLNRVRLAIGFRHAGACVDFEDWDGLSDDQVRQRAQYTSYGWISQQNGMVLYDPDVQAQAVRGLQDGDSGMFVRAQEMGVFDLLIKGAEK
jgi:hypothetical protein